MTFKGMLSLKETSVMILGESGTGKETVAMQIHYGSTRRKKKLVWRSAEEKCEKQLG